MIADFHQENVGDLPKCSVISSYLSYTKAEKVKISTNFSEPAMEQTVF